MAVTLAAAMLAGPSADALVVARFSHDRAPCSGIDWRESSAHRVRLIRCATRPEAFGPVPGGWRRAVEIARCESYPEMRPRVVTGSSVGVFQLNSRWARAWWERWAKPLGMPYRLKNAYINTVIAISKASSEGWSAWSCA